MRLDIWLFVRWGIDFKILGGKLVWVDPRAETRRYIEVRSELEKNIGHVSDVAKRCVSGCQRGYGVQSFAKHFYLVTTATVPNRASLQSENWILQK